MLHRKSQRHGLSTVFDAGQRANELSQLTQSYPRVSAAPADDVHCLFGLRQNPEAVAIRFQVVDSCRECLGAIARHRIGAQMSALYALSLRRVSSSLGQNATKIELRAGG